MKKTARIILVALIAALVFSPAFADEQTAADQAEYFYTADAPAAETPVGDWKTAFQSAVESAGMDAAMAQAMGNNIPVKDIVKAAVEMGYNPYVVMVAAVKAGGFIGDIIASASEAGVSSAVISRAAIDAGADAFGIAREQNTEQGFAYTPAEGDTTAPAGSVSPAATPTTTTEPVAARAPDPAPRIGRGGPASLVASSGVTVGGGGGNVVYVSPSAPIL